MYCFLKSMYGNLNSVGQIYTSSVCLRISFLYTPICLRLVPLEFALSKLSLSLYHTLWLCQFQARSYPPWAFDRRAFDRLRQEPTMRHLFAKGCLGVRHSIILSKLGTFLKNEKLPYYTSKGLTLRKEHMCSRLSFLKFSSHWKLARAPPPPQKFYLQLVFNGQKGSRREASMAWVVC